MGLGIGSLTLMLTLTLTLTLSLTLTLTLTRTLTLTLTPTLQARSSLQFVDSLLTNMLDLAKNQAGKLELVLKRSVHAHTESVWVS